MQKINIAMTGAAAAVAFGVTNICLAQPITIGSTTVPLGSDAFANDVRCISATCGGDFIFLTPPPQLQFIGTLNTLKANYILDGVLADLADDQNVRLNFPVPIENQPGPDIYLAQAQFGGGSDLSFQDPVGINDFGVLFDNAPATWHTVSAGDFVQDTALSARSVYFSDGGAPEGGYYYLYYTTIDLNDFGYAAGAEISGFNIRGPALTSVPDNNYLDVVTVANLNAPPTPIEIWRTMHFSAEDLADPLKEATVWGNDADPDGDGRRNWHEYVFRGVPAVADAAAMEPEAEVMMEGGVPVLYISFNRRTNDPALIYSLEVSAGMEMWFGGPDSVEETGVSVIDGDFESATFRGLEAIPADRLFGRVEVARDE